MRNSTSDRRAGLCGLLCLTVLAAVACGAPRGAADPAAVHLSPVGTGWARSSVNAVIFRKNSVVTHRETQYTAYYDPDGVMVLASRTHGTDRWTVQPTQYSGNVRDAHNAISIDVDGGGYLHVAWDHHGQPLNYARSLAPGSLQLGERIPMTGQRESRVTYPQFIGLADGALLALYRDGASGGGDVLLNRYHLATRHWSPVQHPLIAGEGERNAYVNQLVVDGSGGWHLSWTWRETPDVASNHDILYAFSPDQGRSWRRSDGTAYRLPITAAQAEVAAAVPQGSGLINQTSMAVDEAGRPMVATYWRPAGSTVPQYFLVWRDGRGWRTSRVGARTQPFELGGTGTRRIPVSRPQLLAGRGGEVVMVFRDDERGGGITIARTHAAGRDRWELIDLRTPGVGLWEPSYDPVAWERLGELHLFHQRVGQGQGETLEEMPPQPVSILEWTP